MNCANHPETPAVAYCQYCGKPLCAQCIHKVNNIISCEPCLAARIHATTAGGYGQASPYAGPIPPNGWQPHPWGTDPWVAFGLSWIPGVGAMYNGQFAKGLAHVVIFALLINMAHLNGALGLLVAGWVFYQVFDAYQTAIARRDGLPLPNSLGLNNIGQWFGTRHHAPYPGANPVSPNPAAAPGVVEPPPVSGFASEYAPPYNQPPIPPGSSNPYDTHDLWHRCGSRGVPTGAVVLIVLGVLFLLGNFGILSRNWFDHGWPILLIALGIWMVIRRSQNPPTGGVR